MTDQTNEEVEQNIARMYDVLRNALLSYQETHGMQSPAVLCSAIANVTSEILMSCRCCRDHRNIYRVGMQDYVANRMQLFESVFAGPDGCQKKGIGG